MKKLNVKYLIFEKTSTDVVKYIAYLAFLYENHYVNHQQLIGIVKSLRNQRHHMELKPKRNFKMKFNNNFSAVSKRNVNALEVIDQMLLDLEGLGKPLTFSIETIVYVTKLLYNATNVLGVKCVEDRYPHFIKLSRKQRSELTYFDYYTHARNIKNHG